MIYKRMAARLRAQDWVAITIELAIVVVGVFIGTQVSNWNAARIERQDNARVLRNLRPEIADMIANFRTIYTYYDTSNHYAQIAFAGWRRDPQVSDRDFAVGAFQALTELADHQHAAAHPSLAGQDDLPNVASLDLAHHAVTGAATMASAFFFS